MHEGVVLDAHKQVTCQIDRIALAQCQIEGSLLINIVQHRDSHPLPVARNRTFIGQVHEFFQLGYVHALLDEHVEDCFDVRENVEAELDKALSIDAVDIEIVGVSLIYYFLDNLPVEDGKTHF